MIRFRRVLSPGITTSYSGWFRVTWSLIDGRSRLENPRIDLWQDRRAAQPTFVHEGDNPVLLVGEYPVPQGGLGNTDAGGCQLLHFASQLLRLGSVGWDEALPVAGSVIAFSVDEFLHMPEPCSDLFPLLLGEVREVLVSHQTFPKSWGWLGHPAVDFGDLQVQQAAVRAVCIW